MPQFEHLLIDQTEQNPESVEGTLVARLAQLAMMTEYRRAGWEGWDDLLNQVVQLVDEMYPAEGIEGVAVHVEYVLLALKTNEQQQAFAEAHGDDKTYGLVVDYWGVSSRLQDALAIFSTAEVQGALTSNVDELPRLQTRHAGAMKFFRTVTDTSDLDACVRVLEPEDLRAAFDLAFRRFGQSMDMLLPDHRALAYHADLRWLGKIRGAARARYRDDRLDLSGCGEKVRTLIADAVVADGIEILIKEVPLFSPEFEEKIEALPTDEAKASEMEHAIRHEISAHMEENPAFYRSLRERLEEIVEKRRLERIDAAEQLSLLSSLRGEAQGEQTQAQELGLDARGYAIYGLLASKVEEKKTAVYDTGNRDLAADLDEAIEPFTQPGRLVAEGGPAAPNAAHDQAAPARPRARGG